MPTKPEPDINPSVYEWTGRVMSVLEMGLGIDIRLHENGTRLAAGDIFVFNHFARFETFIPQYLIHRETGAYCRSIASSEFFAADDAFANFSAQRRRRTQRPPAPPAPIWPRRSCAGARSSSFPRAAW